MTFVEMAVASAIFATLMGAVFSLISVGQSATDSGIMKARLDGRARSALDRIANELRGSQVQPFPNGVVTSSTIVYKRRYSHADPNQPDPYSFDLVSGDVNWNALPTDVIKAGISPTEQENGVDDDGDGIVDEWVVLKTSNGIQTTLCPDVAPNGLTFRFASPRKLEISLRVMGVDGRKNRIVVDASTLVFLRN
ncbi:MAG: hypothetical protein HYR85_04510 [Planctomycetes bacterium]|nr:hypothetical protein [Planctomycetota bacterium]MBI3844100.1 hypothetical protein [Planctomycetota bacterium]